ncbi:MAG: hypothetical protein UDB11_10240 [Peptococcaceae bacterium]|nr:hypothetical protein [Peptococcaceae bacterium]
MMAQVVVEFVIGFVIGAVVCLGKEFLFQRFVLIGSKFLAALLFWMRLLIDAVVLVGTFLISIPALLGAAAGLSVYMVVLIVKAFRKKL